MPAPAEIVEPGRYGYRLTIEFPSVYVPEHTPLVLWNANAQQTVRTRHESGRFDLAVQVGREVLRDHIVRQVCEDVDQEIVTVTRFDLIPVTA
jgi:hypothetical protein